MRSKHKFHPSCKLILYTPFFFFTQDSRTLGILFFFSKKGISFHKKTNHIRINFVKNPHVLNLHVDVGQSGDDYRIATLS